MHYKILLNPLQRHNRHFGVALLFLSAAIYFLSCTSIHLNPDSNVNEQLKAENRIMMKNLNLAMRENSVLKDENIQYRDDNSRLNSRIKFLESDIESLKKKYEQDIALQKEKNDNLNKKIAALQSESAAKIKELTDINKALDDRMTSEIGILNENIRKQEEKFISERAAAESLFLAKETEYQKQIAQMRNDAVALKTELESLRSQLAESESGLKTANEAATKRDEALKQSENQNRSKDQTIKSLNEQLSKNEARIKELSDSLLQKDQKLADTEKKLNSSEKNGEVKDNRTGSDEVTR